MTSSIIRRLLALSILSSFLLGCSDSTGDGEQGSTPIEPVTDDDDDVTGDDDDDLTLPGDEVFGAVRVIFESEIAELDLIEIIVTGEGIENPVTAQVEILDEPFTFVIEDSKPFFSFN